MKKKGLVVADINNRKILINNKEIDLTRFTKEISPKDINAKLQPLFDFFDLDKNRNLDVIENFIFSKYILENFIEKDGNNKDFSDADIKALQEEFPAFANFTSTEIKEFVLQMYSVTNLAHDIESSHFIVDHLSNYVKNNEALLDNVNYGGAFDKVGAFFTELWKLDFNTFENLNENTAKAEQISTNLVEIQSDSKKPVSKKEENEEIEQELPSDYSLPTDNTIVKKEVHLPILTKGNSESQKLLDAEYLKVTEEKYIAIKEYLEKESGKKIEPYQFTEFIQKSGKYTYLRGLKQKAEQLNKDLEKVKRLYDEEKSLQYNRSPYATTTLKGTWRDAFGEAIRKYFEEDETLKQLAIEAIGTDFGPQSDYKELRNILNNLEKMSNELYAEALNGEDFSTIEEDYKESFKNLYGIEEVSSEVLENVTSSLENSGMFKIGLLIAINLILTHATSGTATPYMKALISKYGATTVQMAIRIVSSLMTTGISYGLDVFNELTSTDGITMEDLEKINTQTLHTAGIIMFSSFITGPIAQKITNSIEVHGVVEKAFVNGSSKVINGITTTTVTANNFIKAIENYYKSVPGITQKVVANTVGLAAEIPMFAMYETLVSELSYDESLKSSAETLTKIKIISYLLNALLGRSINYLSSSITNNNAQTKIWEVRLEKKYLDNIDISEIKTPDGKISYNVSLQGNSLFTTKNPNELTMRLVSTIAQTLSKQEIEHILGQYDKLQNQVNEAKKLLGIPEDALLTAEVIEKAWKAKVKVTHPDKRNGSHDYVTAVNGARDLLKSFINNDLATKVSAQSNIKGLPSKSDALNPEASNASKVEANTLTMNELLASLDPKIKTEKTKFYESARNAIKQIKTEFHVELRFPENLLDVSAGDLGAVVRKIYVELLNHKMLDCPLDKFENLTIEFTNKSLDVAEYDPESNKISFGIDEGGKVNLENVQYALRHEIIHRVDTKAELGNSFPESFDKNKTETYIKELLESGLSEEEAILAMANRAEFIAYASMGDMSKFSADMRTLLIECGMPEKAFGLNGNESLSKNTYSNINDAVSRVETEVKNRGGAGYDANATRLYAKKGKSQNDLDGTKEGEEAKKIVKECIPEKGFSSNKKVEIQRKVVELLKLGIIEDDIKFIIESFKDKGNQIPTSINNLINNLNGVTDKNGNQLIDTEGKPIGTKEIIQAIKNIENSKLLQSLSNNANHSKSLAYLIQEVGLKDAIMFMSKMELGRLNEAITKDNNLLTELNVALDNYKKAQEEYVKKIYDVEAAEKLLEEGMAKGDENIDWLIGEVEEAKEALITATAKFEQMKQLVINCLVDIDSWYNKDFAKIYKNINNVDDVKNAVRELLNAGVKKDDLLNFLHVDENGTIYSAKTIFKLEDGKTFTDIQKKAIDTLGGIRKIFKRIESMNCIKKKNGDVIYEITWKKDDSGKPIIDWEYIYKQLGIETKETVQESTGQFQLEEVKKELNKTKLGSSDYEYQELLSDLNKKRIDNTELLNILNSKEWEYTGELTGMQQTSIFINLHDRLRFIERVIFLDKNVTKDNINGEIDVITNKLYEKIDEYMASNSVQFEHFTKSGANLTNFNVQIEINGQKCTFTVGLDTQRHLITIFKYKE